MKYQEEAGPPLERLQFRALSVGALGLLGLVIGSFASTRQFSQSYLFGYLFWLLMALGCLGVLLLHHLVSGAWGHIVQRLMEAGAGTLPYMALLFLPVLLGLQNIFPWSRPADVAASEVIQKKTGYLNIPFFIVRAAFFFILWSATAYFLSRWSQAQDTSGDPALTERIRKVSGPAMVVFVLTVTFAGVDWMMSLEPEWYSTIYGMLIVVSAVLSTLAFGIIGIRLLSGYSPFSRILTSRHYHHLGNMLFAFTILWAYMAFSQYLIIWSGNLADDNFWYIRRLGLGWQSIAVVLLIGHFFVPFFLLLSRKSKRSIVLLSFIAGGILIMHFVDLFWLIMPAFNDHRLQVHWLDLAAPVGIGGIWLAIFLQQLKGHPLLPLHDPRFNERGENIHSH